MNVADSQRVASALEKLGYLPTPDVKQATVIVLNTCVVRQSAENKAHGRLTSLRPLKEKDPALIINLMGCMVGVKGHEQMREQYPFVDVFSPPSDPVPLLDHLLNLESKKAVESETRIRYDLMDGDLLLPEGDRGSLVSAYVPVVYGCSHACTYCVIPFRRGVERSRPIGEIIPEVESLVAQGVVEVTLLGQIVDRYGLDIDGNPGLEGLLSSLHEIEGLKRIRFLTSHPNWMIDDLIDAVALLPKVCEHIEVPIQSGDDEILARMRRGYTAEDYRLLIKKLRGAIPGVSIATDIIVGFPGETEAQFQNSYDLLEDLALDVAHLARYSPRPQTVSSRRMTDDVPEDEKMRRFRRLEDLQAKIGDRNNARFVGKTEEVLVEEKQGARWKGRTRTNKLVFFEADADLRGELVEVKIEWAGPWSMIGVPDGRDDS
jgi:tRNA-2-methylthio-N6-dimethylallyladenosine synthase